MLWVAAFVAAAIVLAIAAVVVSRESRRLAAEEYRPVFDLEDAVTWVAEHVPFEVAAELSHDDVRRILRWHLDYVRVRSASPNGREAHHAPGPVVVGGADVVSHLVQRSEAAGHPYTSSHVGAVLDAELGYLHSIGAIGPAADPGEGTSS